MNSTLPCGRTRPERHTIPTSQKVTEWQEKLRAYLKQNGLKYTEQRWLIARLILETGGHLDAQSLVAQLKKKHSGVGEATVYRSIKVLCDAGLLETSHQDLKGRVLYELPDAEHHDHMICLDCDAIFEFHDKGIEKLQDQAARNLDFKVSTHKHIIYARCTYRK